MTVRFFGIVGVAAALAVAASGVGAASAPYGSDLSFHGWSKDSRYAAYTRVRVEPRRDGRGPSKPTIKREHREFEAGKLVGFGSAARGDVEGWARDHHYKVVRWDPEAGGDPRAQRFIDDAGNHALTLTVRVGEDIGWTLATAGGRVVATHTFDTIYVGVRAALFPAPDHSQALLVLWLDRGWITDVAVTPVRLPRRATTAAGSPPPAAAASK